MAKHEQTLLAWLQRGDAFGERPAVISFDKEELRQTSYAELGRLSDRFATGLKQRDVELGERIALIGTSSLAWITACMGTIKAGAIPVPIDAQFDDEALVHVLDDSQPRLILADSRVVSRLEELELELPTEVLLLDDEEDERNWRNVSGDATDRSLSIDAQDEAVLFYTSGTTGPPKGVPLSQENIASQINELLDADLVQDDDRVLLPLPLHHVYPFVVGAGCVVIGDC